MKMKNLTICIALVTGALVSTANAAMPTNTTDNSMNGWFFGIGANHDAITSQQGHDLGAATAVTGNQYSQGSYNGGDVGFNVFLGKTITDNFSLSLTYAQAGKSSYAVEDSEKGSTADITYKASATYLSGAYAVPVANHVNVSAIAGVAYISATQSATVTNGSFSKPFATGSINGFDYLYGFGIDYKISNVKVGASYLLPGDTQVTNAMLNLNVSYYL